MTNFFRSTACAITLTGLNHRKRRALRKSSLSWSMLYVQYKPSATAQGNESEMMTKKRLYNTTGQAHYCRIDKESKMGGTHVRTNVR